MITVAAIASTSASPVQLPLWSVGDVDAVSPDPVCTVAPSRLPYAASQSTPHV
jgi:hypothetical protein